MRTIEFGIGFELKPYGGYILDIREEPHKFVADFIDAHCGLYRAYLGQNDYENAEAAVLTARHLAPNATEVLSLCDAPKETYYHKGITCYNEKRYRETVDCFQKTMTFDATYIAAYHAQALVYFGLHNGIIDAGENVRLKLIITNAGSAAKNLSVRMLPKTIDGLRYQLPKTTFSIRKNGFQTRRIP